MGERVMLLAYPFTFHAFLITCNCWVFTMARVYNWSATLNKHFFLYKIFPKAGLGLWLGLSGEKIPFRLHWLFLKN